MSYTSKYDKNRRAYNELIQHFPERIATIEDGAIKGIIIADQRGGSMSEAQFERNKVHNRTVFFDKGTNNPWMEQVSSKSQLMESAKRVGEDVQKDDVNELTQAEFEKYLGAVMRDRYYVRESNLRSLMKLLDYRYGPVLNMNFLDDFYMNMFKGTAFKTFFADDIFKKEGNDDLLNDLRKRYNIFIEFDETAADKIPTKRYYTFTDNPNPCHLINIMKDEFGRDGEDTGDKVKYAFANTRELGKGKAGTVSLFSYYPSKTAEKLQIAVKLMASNQFHLTNNAKYLPLRITYFANQSGTKLIRTDKNVRYVYPENEAQTINENYPGYPKFNMYGTQHRKYPMIALSCASDNFSNQTIQHMALEAILDEHGIDNYVKQYDAMLCWNTTQDIGEGADTMIDYIRKGIWTTADLISKKLEFENATVDGVNFMEIAAGDLHDFLFETQKEYFSQVREINDLREECATTYASDFGIESGISTNYDAMRHLLGEIISQLFQPLSILQHPKYAFVHGDLKSKNVFVKHIKPDEDPTGKGRNFVFKIADYDKSSITYNGIRFYNEGMGPVKFMNEHWGLGQYEIKEDAKAMAAGKPHSLSTESGDKVFHRESIDDEDYIKHIFRPAEAGKIDKVQIIYDLIIRYVKYPNTRSDIAGSAAPVAAPVAASAASAAATGPENADDIVVVATLVDIIKRMTDTHSTQINQTLLFRRLHSNLEQIVKVSNKPENTEDYQKIDTLKDEPMNGIAKCIELLVKIQSGGDNIDFYYNLNSFITRLSVTFTTLESLEMEQLYVRYSPIPFYHTIDLYTLFLSMLQSPMVLTYLKYCQYYATLDARHVTVEDDGSAASAASAASTAAAAATVTTATTAAADRPDLSNDLFWQSFRDLWVNSDDVDTILGYYDYLYHKPTTEDQGSIGFILDPIKKNPISLVKRVPNEYWKRAWEWAGVKDKWADFVNSNEPEEMRKVRLSSGSFLRMPNVCLTDKCDSFKMKVHRGSTVFYLNQDMIVYNASGIGEKVTAMQAKQRTQQEAIESIAESLSYSIVDYLKRNKRNTALSEEFDVKIDVTIDVDKAKQALDNHPLFTQRLVQSYKIKDLTAESIEMITEALEDDDTEIESLNYQKKQEILKRMDWLVTHMKSNTKAEGGYEISRDKWEIKSALESLNKYYDAIIHESSKESQHFFEYIDGLITKSKIVAPTKDSNIYKYAEKIQIDNGDGIGDITGVCKTNVYLDSLGNPANWDFCYKTDDDIMDLIRGAIEGGFLPKYTPLA